LVAFEWNEEKRQATLLKHGIDFRDAVEVLVSDHLSVGARSEAEDRNLAIGLLNGIAIAVVYTMRGDICRIITARRGDVTSENTLKRFSLDEIRKLKSRTEWDRLAAEGDFSGAVDIDIDWASARIVEPENKKMVSLRLDTDVLAFFRKQGKGYQTRINAVLKAYKDAQEKHS